MKLSNCHTEALGFAIGKCQSCGQEEFLGFLGCHDKNCPTCSGNRRYKETIKMCENIFRAPYFSYVFTLPHELNEIFEIENENWHRKALDIFMDSVSYILMYYSKNIECQGVNNQSKILGETDIVTFLHTWDQELKKHIHVHAIISSIGYSIKDQKINEVQKNKNEKMFLFSNVKISRDFRDLFLERLEKELIKSNTNEDFKNRSFSIINQMKEKDFNVFAEEPVSGNEYAVIYLMQYMNRIGMSPFRIRKIKDSHVYLRRKRPPSDYQGNKEEYDFDALENCFYLSLDEFLNRYSSHILPKKFKTMRRCGLYNYYREKLKSDKPLNIDEKYLPKELDEDKKREIREIMIKNSQGVKEQKQEQSYKTNFKTNICRQCGKENDFKIYIFDRLGNYKGKEIVPESVIFKSKILIHLQNDIFKKNIHHRSIRSLIKKVEKKDDS